MSLLDDLLNKCLEYYFVSVKKESEKYDDAIKSIRISMRALSSSLNEIALQLEAGLHKLRRHQSDPGTFFQVLRQMVDQDHLIAACNESGICKELRVAQDELFNMSAIHTSSELDQVKNFASQLEGYESAFVGAVREFLAQARGVDLTAAIATSQPVSTKDVIQGLEERINALRKVCSKVDSLLTEIRYSAI
jgi:glutamine synthetase adenylyltransferase